MKSLVNYPLLKEQLKRFWAIAVLSVLWYLFFVVSPLYSAVSNLDAQYAAENLIQIVSMKNPAMLMASVGAPFVAILSVFSYLFLPKSTTAMHTLPVNKKQLFSTNITAALVLITIPLLILCAFLLRPVIWSLPEMRVTPEGIQYLGYIPRLPVELFPQGLGEGQVINTLPIVAGFFFRTLLTAIFYCALFLLAVMVAGNAVVSSLLCVVFPFIPCAFMLLGYLTGSFYLFGFEAYNFGNALNRLLTFTNAAALGAAFSLYNPVDTIATAESSIRLYYGVYILIAAALATAAFWCNAIRKQERAGDSVVFVPFRNFLIFLLSTAGMIFLGAFFLGIFKNTAFLYVGFLLGFVIAFFIGQMIAEKTFNVLYKAKSLVKFGGVMVVLLAIVIAAARFDLLGYQTYSPAASEVAGVYLHPQYTIYNRIDTDNTGEYKKSFFITDEKIISDTLSVHKNIIENRFNLRSAFLRQMEGNWAEEGITDQYFMFLLTDGRYVTRKYALPEEFRQSSGMKALMCEEPVILSQYNSFNRPEEIERVTLQYVPQSELDIVYDKETYTHPEPIEAISIEETSEIVSVLEEIKKDIVVSERERLNNPDGLYGSSISGYTEIVYETGWRTADHFSLSSYENVEAWLEARGLMPEI